MTYDDTVHFNLDQVGHIIIWVSHSEDGRRWVEITDGDIRYILGGIWGPINQPPKSYIDVHNSPIGKDNPHIKQLLAFIKAWWDIHGTLPLSEWMAAYAL